MQPNHGLLESIRAVVQGVIECARHGLEYTGEVGVQQRLKSQLILTTSSDAQHIADWYEDGFGLRRTTEMLNEIRIERGDMHIGVAAVHNCVLRLAALARPVLPHAQSGGEDWRKAVHGWAAQIMVRKGMEIPIEHHPALHGCVFRQAGFVRRGWTPPLTWPPPAWNPHVVTPLADGQSTSYDEVHKEPKGLGEKGYHAKKKVQ